MRKNNAGDATNMADDQGILFFRIRYSETDQMKNYYNSRALEWFEYGRGELLRDLGKPYTQWERENVLLPVIESYIKFEGKASYDDRLKMTTTVARVSRTRIRFDCQIEHADSGLLVCQGWTVHAVTDESGKTTRPPKWIDQLIIPSRLDNIA